MKMQNCPKFERCSAPICPLNEQPSAHLKGEPVCYYLRELVKQGGKAKISGCLPEEIVEALENGLPVILSRWSDIKFQLGRSAQTGSRIDALARISSAAT